MDMSLRFIRNGDVDVTRRTITVRRNRTDDIIIRMAGKPKSGDYAAHLKLADGKELLVRVQSEYTFRHMNRRTIMSSINSVIKGYGVVLINFGLFYNDSGDYYLNGKRVIIDTVDDEDTCIVVEQGHTDPFAGPNYAPYRMNSHNARYSKWQ